MPPRDSEGRFRRVLHSDLWLTVLPAVILVAGAFAFTLLFVKPAPPTKIVIAVAPDEGGSRYYARRYQEILKRYGITLDVRQTGGSLANVKLLADPHSGVDVAFVQSGTAGSAEAPHVVSLGSVAYVPLWVFHRLSAIGDISELRASRYDAILCRGVLNDLLDDRVRETVFAAFGRVLHQAGVLILDVREWEATQERKTREPLFRKRVATSRGLLTFTSVTTLEPVRRELLIDEEHTLETDDEKRSRSFHFVMRCWTKEELQSLLQRNGFKSVAYFGAYDSAVAPGATDRLVVVAQRSGDST